MNISFDLVDPVLQLQQRQLGLQEVQAGLKSMETYWAADARLEDASGERKRLLMDWVRKNPMIHQALAMEVAKEEGIESLVERALSMAQGGDEGGGAGAAAAGGMKRRAAVLPALAERNGLTPGVSSEVSRVSGVPAAEVHGTGTFYDLLASPDVRLRVCQGLSCTMRGSESLLVAARDAGLAAAGCSCLAACDRAPAVLSKRSLSQLKRRMKFVFWVCCPNSR